MKMGFRWFGKENDTVSLQHIKQIPGVEGIVWALHDIPAGEEWPLERIMEIKNQADQYQFNIDVVESVNVHDSIKLGLADRVHYIENYKKTIKNLSQAGVKVICYNFQPAIDFIRSDFYKPLPDKSTALFYEKAKIDNLDPWELAKKITTNQELTIPGWEPDRLKDITSLLDAYQPITEDDLWSHLQYFLEQIIPVAEESNIKMAIHPDDPPWSVFGLPRIMKNKEDIRKVLKLIDSPFNGVTLCSGALGANPDNNVPEMIKEFIDRIPFAHIRNLKRFENGDFIETSHRTCDGSLDMYEIVKAYHDNGYTGYVRPDHGRHIFDEKCRPGYGLYDRALGVMYLWGIWDTLERVN